MSIRKTTAERIADTKEKIGQYEKRMKLLVQEQKEKARKERTRRLIERGAILESLIDKADTLTNEQVKTLLTAALNTEPILETLIAMQEQNAPPAATETAQDGGAAAEAQASPSTPQAEPKPAEAGRENAAATAQNAGKGAGKAG
jgi:hypothetical protein